MKYRLLDRVRLNHPLAPAMPVIRRLLAEDAAEAGLLVAVSDAAGRLLWVEGPRAVRTEAERIHFVEGAQWSEERAGTNAPGTALRLDQPVQIFASEHLAPPVTRWSCSAAPIHDPFTGAVLGALDLTGGDDVAAPRTLSLVRATVAAVEGELRVRRLLAGGVDASTAPAHGLALRALGRPQAVIEHDDGATTRLGLRHSEILVLLAAHLEGMSGEQLGAALHERDRAPVTLRAELSRLRGLLPGVELSARPYRFATPLPNDADHVRRLLRQGDLSAAVDAYRGPLLPLSEAPGIARLRDDLHATVRRAVLDGGDPDALLRFADTDHGRHDWPLWGAAARVVSPASSRYHDVQRHLATLDAELGPATLPQR